ncbi:hypothetical protein [Gracilimonas amylolytica]|uniref:hypothetical protein n=1 Tax=Gracilimonas amylolytica TaxID=1749045 RepID=UPI0012FFE349|nr:hypothetical protein [Gracilimonas amylolytica]
MATFVAFLMFLSSPLFAQTLPNVLGDPYYGTAELGNSASSVSQDILAGGSFDLSEMNGDYEGFISSVPDLQLTYEASNSELNFTVEVEDGADDPVILIFSPSGEFHFNDDGDENGYNSEITIENPESGNYAVWVGNYDAEDFISTTLVISEINRYGNSENTGLISNASFDELDISEDPYYGDVTLESGFMPDPYVKTITAGGSVDLSQYGYSGYTAAKPDIDFYFTPSSNANETLTISVNSETDTILLINDPEGTWYFSDDSNGVNPAITFQDPKDGLYSIFVGTFDSENAEAELVISEL